MSQSGKAANGAKPDVEKSAAGAPGEGTGASAKGPTPEMIAKLAEFRSRLATTFSQVTLALLGTPRYRNQSIADLEWLVLEPLLRDRIAIASAKKAESEDAAGMIGLAIWAKVSDEVNEKIEEQVKAGTFPTRLKADDWNSGATVWLLDVVAPNRALATSVLVNFGKLAKGAPVRIHPLISRLVDPDILAKLGRKSVSEPPEM